MQFDLRKFIASRHDNPTMQSFSVIYLRTIMPVQGSRSRSQPSLTQQTDGDEVRMTLRAKASVHGECARCLDPVTREETVDTEWIVKERDLDDPDFDLPLDEKGHSGRGRMAQSGVYVPDPDGAALQPRLRRALPAVR